MAILEKTKNYIDESVFGTMPKRPLHLSVRPISVNENFLGGKATLKELQMELDFGDKTALLPFIAVIPKAKAPCPAVIEVRGEKEIDIGPWVNKGYALFSIYYRDITENNCNFKSGISAYIAPSRRRRLSAGKVCVWAWAAIRALEYAADTEEIDESKIGVTGKGIFALSAMLTGDAEKGFSFVLPENMPKVDNGFKDLYPHLFSPKFLKNSGF